MQYQCYTWFPWLNSSFFILIALRLLPFLMRRKNLQLNRKTRSLRRRRLMVLQRQTKLAMQRRRKRRTKRRRRTRRERK